MDVQTYMTGVGKAARAASRAMATHCAALTLSSTTTVAFQFSVHGNASVGTVDSSDKVIYGGDVAALSVVDVPARVKSGATFPNGCHVAEIEIDPATGSTTLVRYVSVDDAGRVISEQLVHGQMQGGVVQGWGQAFCENTVYDPLGQLSSGSFMDYAMPRAGDVPELLRSAW